MIQRCLLLFQVLAMALVLCCSASVSASGPPKPSSPKKCSVSHVGEASDSAAGVALLAIGLVVVAARRRARD
jgi:MYXO-CTERM domain-containing protein